MSQNPPYSIDALIEEVRESGLPLGTRLDRISTLLRETMPEFDNAINRFVGRLVDSDAGARAPNVGESMPPFMLPDDQGHLVRLEQLLESAPVAIAFHRGHWCPFCRLAVSGLTEVQQDISPVQIVAISAETATYSRKIKREARADFPFLTDFGNGYALSLNLAIWVDDAMSALMAASGRDIPLYQGTEGWILPIPSVFVVGQDGLVKSRSLYPDYRHRLELDDLRAAAKSAVS